MWFQPLSQWFLAVALVSQSGGGPALTPQTQSPEPTTKSGQAATETPGPSAGATAPPATSTATDSPAAPDSPAVIATRHPMFTIPFRVEPSGDSTWRPIEAQLHVSTDRGAHWRLYAKTPTAKQQFTFRSGGDGEYWFAIRTADRAGRVRPETIAEPGLRVLVDTKPPAIKISAQAVEGGQIMVRWKIDEPHIKPDSLKIFYRPSPDEPWTSAPIEPQWLDVAAVSQNGQSVFQPKTGATDVLIRVEVSDTAGNGASAQARVKLDRAAGAAAGAAPNGSVSVAAHPAVGNKYASPGKTSNRNAAFPGLPPGERPRMVNARTFELGYDLDSVGPSGIGRVELWCTRDGGQSWQPFNVESQGRSFLRVKVDDEGLYGFRAVVSNGAGVGGKPPKSGDLPDLWIGVDLTKPTARIVSAEPGVGAEAGRLIISWQADDLLLAARPISFFFSENRNGPWTPIAGGMENTGRYAWLIDGRTPPKIYLRLEVRDEAGNVGAHETAEPVVVDQSRPTARLRDVRPVDQEVKRPVWRP